MTDDSAWQSRALEAEAKLRKLQRHGWYVALRDLLPSTDELIDARCALRAAKKIGALRSGTAWFDRIEAAVEHRDSPVCTECGGTGEDRHVVIDTYPAMHPACSTCRGTGRQ